MKKTLLIILFISLGFSQQEWNMEFMRKYIVDGDTLIIPPNSRKPYTGKVFSLYNDGKKKEEGKYRNGLKDGKWTSWYENGQKKSEKNYKDGELHKDDVVNIYDSDEYKKLTKKEIIVGESIWATSCFRCHRYGTKGAVVAENKEYWDKVAGKGIDALYESVWKGYKGKNGMCPAKGFCNLCNEDEIRKSVFYMFHLAKKVQAANEKKSILKNN